ncbi:MAG: hypothetical protein R6V13_11715 [Anaerolineae bacterium]
MSTTENTMIKALGIAGRLGEGSYNRALLRAARDLALDDLEVDIFDNETLKRILGQPPRDVPETLRARTKDGRYQLEGPV